MLKLIRAVIHFFYSCIDIDDDGGLARLLTLLMSNWVFIPFWLYAFNTYGNFEASISQLLWGLPVVTLILFPIGAIQFFLYYLALSTLNRLFCKPRVIAD